MNVEKEKYIFEDLLVYLTYNLGNLGYFNFIKIVMREID